MPQPSAPRFNHRMTVAYDGRAFFGWQRHGDKATIQGALERAVEAVFGQRCPVRGSGRTDRGAHARGQVASVELDAALAGEALGEASRALNQALPDTIRVLELSPADPGFHACDSAIGKRYRYELCVTPELPPTLEGRVWHLRKPVDAQAMAAACEVFVGAHDFASFATATNFEKASTRREITHARLRWAGPRLSFEVCADGFLYKMVRNIVHALVKVGEGRSSSADLRRILAAKDRKAATGTAPASGLYLDQVFYAGERAGLSPADEPLPEVLP